MSGPGGHRTRLAQVAYAPKPLRRPCAALDDRRRRARCTHDVRRMLRQRLRDDPALPTAVDRDDALAGHPILWRWENRAGRQFAVEIHRVLVEQFFASHRRPPKAVTLGFDATDDTVHGTQEGRFFHGYYDHYCFLPL